MQKNNGTNMYEENARTKMHDFAERNSQRTDRWLQREKVGGREMDWEFWISRCKQLYT